MSNHFLKITFSLIGAVTAYTLLRLFVFNNVYGKYVLILYIVPALSGALFYFISDRSIKYLSRSIDTFEIVIHNMSIYEIAASVIGLIAGLIIANLIAIPITRVDIIGIPVAVGLNILFAFLGIYIAISKRGEANSILDPHAKAYSSKLKLLDTSTIIDGRIVDICNAGFLEGKIVVPSFVLEELHHISDSADPTKRSRGRRGLDVIDILQKGQKMNVGVENIEDLGVTEVDDKLVRAAKKFDGIIITNDFNLNKVASIQGVMVLNINELANAVKPLALPGEEMNVQVVKEGKENGQGIGYMNDGTMVVVEGGRNYLNQTIDVVVTSVLQTAAGRMIFAKPKIKYSGETA